jgi:PKHD-type hydroxylase
VKAGEKTSQNMWNTYNYYEVFPRRFNPTECDQIIDLHHTHHLISSKISGENGAMVRNSDLFWLPRNCDTDWIFTRIRDIITLYNLKYGFELGEEMGQAQLTRYLPGQHYEWHMDLGAGQASLRKITAVVALTSQDSSDAGGLEVFYGETVDNKIRINKGDVVVFPSFVMHRASVVESGTRWSLVMWLTGARPLM